MRTVTLKCDICGESGEATLDDGEPFPSASYCPDCAAEGQARWEKLPPEEQAKYHRRFTNVEVETLEAVRLNLSGVDPKLRPAVEKAIRNGALLPVQIHMESKLPGGK